MSTDLFSGAADIASSQFSGKIDAKNLVIIRGAGDLATGVAQALWNCGYDVICTEVAAPSTIRRKVAFSEAVYNGRTKVEGIEAVLCKNTEDILTAFSKNQVSVVVDPRCEILTYITPYALVDVILAKKNLGTSADMAPLTVALGPGFTAPTDAKYVIETQRGHDLGRIITQGSATPNTGIPGLIAGHGTERVLHSPKTGKIYNICKISDMVKAGDTIAEVKLDDGSISPVKATIDGVLRGLIMDGYHVKKGLKIADIDPRIEEKGNCFTISDKARALGGAVLQAFGRYESGR